MGMKEKEHEVYFQKGLENVVARRKFGGARKVFLTTLI
jgi:hypothetical protein